MPETERYVEDKMLAKLRSISLCQCLQFKNLQPEKCSDGKQKYQFKNIPFAISQQDVQKFYIFSHSIK